MTQQDHISPSSAKTVDPVDPVDAAVLVAVDDGYAGTKVAWLSEQGVRCLVLPTAVSGNTAGVSGGADGADIGWYETSDGERFVAGRLVDGEDTRFAGFHQSSMNLVAVQHALLAAGFGGRAVDLVVGLPVADFYRGAQRNEPVIQAKTENLRRPLRPLNGGAAAEIRSVAVAPQAVTAWIDHSFALEDGGLRQRYHGPIGVVDIGGRTTDCTVVLPGADGRVRVDHSRSGTEDIGTLDAMALLGDDILARHRARPRSQALQTALATGRLSLFGREENVEDLVREAVRAVAGRIRRAVDRHLRDVADLDAVLMVGGGAHLFHGLLDYPNMHYPEEPGFCNARGMLKHALRQRLS